MMVSVYFFQTDVLVVSCDLITDIELHLLADVHRVHDSTITALMLSPSEQTPESVAVPGPKSKRKQGNLIAMTQSIF